MLQLRVLLFSLTLVSLTGCVRSERAVTPAARWDEGMIRTHIRQLVQPVAVADSARASRRALYAARRMEAAGLMPARDPSFFIAAGGVSAAMVASGIDPSQAHVLGYVTGRDPGYYGELVLVAADLDRPAGAAALEVARVLALEAHDTQVPERTVLFALWAPPRTGSLGLGDFLANPTWGLEGIARVLLVASDTAAVAESKRLLDERGIASEIVTGRQMISVPAPQSSVSEAFTLLNVTLLAEALDDSLHRAAIEARATPPAPGGK